MCAFSYHFRKSIRQRLRNLHMSQMEPAQWKTSCARSSSSIGWCSYQCPFSLLFQCLRPPPKALDWRLTSRFTVNNWVNTIMQLGDNVSRCCGLAPVFHNQKDANNEFILPKYSGQEFVQVMAVSVFASASKSLPQCVCVCVCTRSAPGPLCAGHHQSAVCPQCPGHQCNVPCPGQLQTAPEALHW